MLHGQQRMRLRFVVGGVSMNFDGMTIMDLFQIENAARKRRVELERERSRVWQTQKLSNAVAVLDPEPGANIGDYCEDLVFHAKRLNHAIHGTFSGFRLEALPDSLAGDLVRRYLSR